MKKPKKPRSTKSPTRRRGTRFVLMVGDEGGILIYLRGSNVLKRLFVASPESSNTRLFNELLEQDARAPIQILVDMMDQNFTRQTLPPVSPMSVNKLIKRRIQKDLAADDIKGSIVLGREKQGRKDWNYMLVSTPGTGLLKQWVDYATERRNPFDGIYLLPLEVESFVQQLAKTTVVDSTSEWQLLVSHNKVGGFRQVILHHGKMVFTRMALPIGESVPEVIAGNIEQEILNTMEYLKRMGYNDSAGLDVFGIISEDIRNAIDTKKIYAKTVTMLTPHEASDKLRLGQAAQSDDHFGDVVIGAFFGSQRKHMLRMQTPYTQKLQSLGQVILGTKVIAAIMIVVFLGLTGQTMLDIFNLMREGDDWDKKMRNAQAQLAETHKKAKQLPGNIEKISDVVTMYKLFDVDVFQPLTFIQRLSETLQEQLFVKTFDWKIESPLEVGANADKRKIAVTADVELVAPSPDPEEQRKQWQAALALLPKGFNDFEVKSGAIPGEIGANEVFKTSMGQDKAPEPPKSVTVAVTFKGPKASTKKPGESPQLLSLPGGDPE